MLKSQLYDYRHPPYDHTPASTLTLCGTVGAVLSVLGVMLLALT